uniref:Uncharacterized protein n=1 Tax=Setaria viridis TaxID=4556 RepID=A0A4U6U6Y7_SETVI|nr:hypothetical protein SEVIR_6G192950v2 [Setaria viridis]
MAGHSRAPARPTPHPPHHCRQPHAFAASPTPPSLSAAPPAPPVLRATTPRAEPHPATTALAQIPRRPHPHSPALPPTGPRRGFGRQPRG